jgi:hypothetical protein
VETIKDQVAMEATIAEQVWTNASSSLRWRGGVASFGTNLMELAESA